MTSLDSVPWSEQPARAEFFQRHMHIGATGRRLAQLQDESIRAALLDRLQARLAELTPEDFRDTSEVLAAVATTTTV